jgi:hypothetical protein
MSKLNTKADIIPRYLRTTVFFMGYRGQTMELKFLMLNSWDRMILYLYLYRILAVLLNHASVLVKTLNILAHNMSNKENL